jgi:hypothetical protein
VQIEAERRLLRAALQDPMNQRFVLLSEDSVPVYSAPAVHLQLVSEQRSRVDACANLTDPGDGDRRATHRWQDAMGGAGLAVELWRKSSQWVGLIRAHAELVAGEEQLNAVFAAECWAADDRERFCISDEHFIPSLLALKGLEGECECGGAAMHTEWRPGGWHPVLYEVSDATAEILHKVLRHGAGCDSASLESAAPGLLAGADVAIAAGAAALGMAEAAGVRVMPPGCPLFARKIAPEAVRSWGNVLALPLARGLP